MMIKYFISVAAIFFFVSSLKSQNAEKIDSVGIVQDSMVYDTKSDDVMPRFPGCEHIKDPKKREKCSVRKMYNYFYRNLRFPEAVQMGKVSGKVYASFMVNKDGYIGNIKILKDIGWGCGRAVKKVLKKMKKEKIKWIPAKQNGVNVSVSYKVPIVFRFAKSFPKSSVR